MAGKIAPSMMCAPLDRIPYYVKEFEKNQIEFLHADVMDGEFVPNMMLGTAYISSLRSMTNIPLDIHLMIVNPESKLDWFDIQPGEYVSVHYESTPHVHRALQAIKNKGAKAMVALNPGTPVENLRYLLPDIDGVVLMTVNPGFAGQKLIPQGLDKIRDTRAYLEERGYGHLMIEVDGNVSWENIPKMAAAGTDVYVAGTSSLFNDRVPLDESIARFRGMI